MAPESGGSPANTDAPRVELPGSEPGPLRKISRRVLVALALVTAVALMTYIGRDGYLDPEDDEITILDAFYYSTVSITTTGYGDIRPVTDGARLVTTLLVTPARVLFLILLVGTTLEILAEHTRTAYRLTRWRKKLQGHMIVCGYGTKGRSAVQTLLAQGGEAEKIVVIETDVNARARAASAGLAVVVGNAASKDVLEEAGVRDSSAVIVAVNRDDSAVLVTLTARELAPDASIVAAVREEENVHLLQQSGADSVITSSAAAGRLLGMATHTPSIAKVLEDLLSVGEGLYIVQKEVEAEDIGPLSEVRAPGPVVAVLRGRELLRFDDERASMLQRGDRLVTLLSHTGSRNTTLEE